MNLDNISIYIQHKKTRQFLTAFLSTNAAWIDHVAQFHVHTRAHYDMLCSAYHNHIISIFDHDRLIVNKDELNSILFFIQLQIK
jgi:hypothetical protein